MKGFVDAAVGLFMRRSRCAFAAWLVCACGPSIVVDGAQMEDDDASTRTTGPEDTGDDGEGTHATSPTTMSPTTTLTTTMPTTAETGGSSESTTGAPPSCAEIMLESTYCMYAGL